MAQLRIIEYIPMNRFEWWAKYFFNTTFPQSLIDAMGQDEGYYITLEDGSTHFELKANVEAYLKIQDNGKEEHTQERSVED